jgi:glycosyltransferase involved in cell wall biosynthesis
MDLFTYHYLKMIGRQMHRPTVSFLIPTYNAQPYLARCLQSIKDLDYPANKIEIIIADGGSSDNTLSIAKKYTDRIFNNKRRIAEFGKKLAFINSTGMFLVFLDSDNIIASKDWLTRLLEPFREPDVIGVESTYLIANDFTTINKYVALLVIADPLARMMATKPAEQIKKKNYTIKLFSKGSAVVSGANGFIWRRAILDNFQDL